MQEHHIIPKSLFGLLLGEKYELLTGSTILLPEDEREARQNDKVIYHVSHPNYNEQVERLLMRHSSSDTCIDIDTETLEELIQSIRGRINFIHEEWGEIASIDELSLEDI
ncbi:hypothetical protein CQA53_09565 [Helicobacter didelphidarum]|uniref:Uncharacterized protein n=1 Tax=Helicobacter didelphidarum TaxID=2040648 RepID=A0A3D8IAT4_9HELI|nr:hypothetical protein [Helicobacter didelphidarum]RDU62056.1 hypothetical protein CQA53_09565 [Helicobacter didelphidarum]